MTSPTGSAKYESCETSGVQLRLWFFARCFAGLLTPLFLAGCLATPTTRIEAENTGVIQRAVRASFNVNGGGRPAAQPRSGHAVEIGYQGTKVSGNQTLAAGQPPVIHDGTTFSGPDQLRNDFDFVYTDVSWRMREFGASPFGFEFLAGFAQASLGLAVASSAQRATRNFDTVGLQYGLGLMWRTSASSSFQARGTYFLSASTGVNEITKYEIYYANAIHKNLSLRVGYADWKVGGAGESGMSDFQMHFAGPAVVLDCNFNLGD